MNHVEKLKLDRSKRSSWVLEEPMRPGPGHGKDQKLVRQEQVDAEKQVGLPGR
jgi:hypothetical protein